MSKSDNKYHLVASLLAGAAILALTFFAALYGRITPAKVLQNAINNTLTLDSVGFDAAGSYQISRGETDSIQTNGVSLSGSANNLQTPSINWTAKLDFSQATIPTDDISKNQSGSLELAVIDQIAYIKLLKAEKVAISLKHGQQYRLTTDPLTLGLAFTPEYRTVVRQLLTSGALWQSITDVGLVDGKRRFIVKLDWRTLINALPALTLPNTTTAIETVRIEFWLSADSQQIEKIALDGTLTQPTNQDNIQLDLAIQLYSQNQIPKLAVPVSLDTIPRLPTLNLLN